MAHKTLIGGTSYNVVGGKSLVSGTEYNIKGGKILVGGTGYDIKFIEGIYAMLYSSGDFAFQRGDDVEAGKTLSNSYKDFDDVKYTSYSAVPWYSQRDNIKNVYFKDETSPISLAYWFYNARNLKTVNISNLSWNNITNMDYTYTYCYNLTGSPVCGNNVTNMLQTYRDCRNITGSPVCGNKVRSMRNAYFNCHNLTGAPVCGNSVTDMSNAYFQCYNIKGSPACGNNVTNMFRTYFGCRNLIGSPVCGNNVTNMYYAYHSCHNLTGSPVCGERVTNMHNAYANCYGLTGAPVCGNNVTYMRNAYYGCNKLTGNAYFYSGNISNAMGCFTSKNNSKRLNIYLPANSTSLTTCLYNDTSSLVGKACTWTNAIATNGCYYNSVYNIYLYPVTNVAAACATNGDN